ncbi:hypothetical protein CGCF413_v010980 [Colletotrichum fructicola]|nr:hypothetical protein CGCF413_v010980 [Colletotrichum fructicola]
MAASAQAASSESESIFCCRLIALTFTTSATTSHKPSSRQTIVRCHQKQDKMMTSIEIIGFVGAVADFLDLAAENITVAREFGNSGSATTKADVDLERRNKLLDGQINAVHLSGPEFARDGQEAKLLIRVDKYHALTVRLLSLLDGFNSTKFALGKEAKQSLIDELEDWRSKIYLRITKVIRHDLKRLLRDRGNLGYSLRADLEALEHRITPSDGAGDIHNLGFLGVMRNVFSDFKKKAPRYWNW